MGFSDWPFVSCLILVAISSAFAITREEAIERKTELMSHVEVSGGLRLPSKLSRNSTVNSPQSCVSGNVTIDGEIFPCDNVDFLSFVSLKDLIIFSGVSAFDTFESSSVWGWLSPSGREITIQCLDIGVAFLDSTDPTNPIILAKMGTPMFNSPFCDAEVYQDVLYLVRDSIALGDPTYGMEVFNLSRLESIQGNPGIPIDVFPDFVYRGHDSAANLVLNTDTGFLYSAGTFTCAGGLHMMDLKPNPMRPTFVGCAEEDGYTQDAQCVVYDGPDQRYVGEEICFAYNVERVTIWNVQDKSSPKIISRVCYEESVYTHQGWLTDDMSMILISDEFDEICAGVQGCGPATTRFKTTTIYANVTDLENPEPLGRFEHPTRTVDHNL